MPEHTPYQKQIIKNYYKRRDDIMLQRLHEMITDLFLAEGKKRAQLWGRIADALEKLEVTRAKIDKIIEQDDPAQLAELLKEIE